MEHAQPRHLSRRRVEQLLSKVKSHGSAGNRIEILTRHFLGLPYHSHALIGSANTPEVFTVSLDAFDCVVIVRDDDRILLRHASRSRGGVVEQELNEFLKANRMAGVIIARPEEPLS